MRARGFFVWDAMGFLALGLLVLSFGVFALGLAGMLPDVLEIEPAAPTGRGFTRVIAVSNATATQLSPNPGLQQGHARGDCKVATGSPPVVVVEQGAVSTAQGFGTFAAGETFAVPTLAWSLSTAPGGSVSCQFVGDAALGQGGGGLSGGAADATYLRLNTANDPISGTLSSSQAATLLDPTLESTGLQDVCVANAAGSRGVCFTGTNAASADNGVLIQGSAAALSGRASVLIGGPVSGVSDRYVLRTNSAAANGIFSVAGSGGLVNESALNGGQVYLADAAGARTLSGIWTSENTSTGHAFDTTTTLSGALNLLEVDNAGALRAAVDSSGTIISEAGNGCGDLSFEVATGAATGISTNGPHTDLDLCVGGVAAMEVSGTRISFAVDVTSGINNTGANAIVSSDSVGTGGRLRAWNAATTSSASAAATVGIAGLPGAAQTRVPMQQWRYNESTTPTAAAEVFGADGLTATFGGLATAVSWTDYGNTAWNGFASTGTATALPACVAARVGRLYSRISNIGGSTTSNLCWCGCVAGVCSFTALQGTC